MKRHSDPHIKVNTTKAGKKKYQASIWHKGVYYASKTFDDLASAIEYKRNAVLQALAGTLQPAAKRSAQREADAAMHKSMDEWVDSYLESPSAKKHKSSRINDYRKLGKLLADKKLRHFSGRAGARLVQELAANWKASGGLPRSKADHANPNFQGKPLSDQEVRLRLHALMRVLRFAKAEAPEDCSFQVAKLEELFDFKMPAAHGKKRTRQPSDEEFVRLVGHFGLGSEMGQLVLLLDESGCRVSEVSTATGEHLHIYKQDGKVTGGHLHLPEHKTSAATGERDVPLSRHAANVLHQRALLFGRGQLFIELGSTDSICEAFDNACKRCGIDGLQLKDFRRAFINRNKYSVSRLDLQAFFGKTSLLDKDDLSPSDRAIIKSVGHTKPDTTTTYTVPDLEKLAAILSSTSRAELVLREPLNIRVTEEQVAQRVAQMRADFERQLAEVQAMGTN